MGSKRNQVAICSISFAALLLPNLATAVNIANLPMLQDGELSISNDMTTDLTLHTINVQCPKQVTVGARSSVALSCASLRSIRILIRWRLQDGRLVDREQDLAVNNHYTLMWDEELKGYFRLGRVFDESGRIVR